MTYTAKTHAEAKDIARRLRALYGRDGWAVEIVKPLFKGDLYRVNVGA